MSFNTRFSREYAGGSIGGILRKGTSGAANTDASSSVGTAEATPRHVDLLVFGYACKLFRDDDKARDIDQGKHLIPWMNDAACKIDRYDVRGALYDLAPYEPPPGGYGNRLDYLNAEEQRAEQLCEEERYLYLYFNEEEHILQQEEDLKRLQQVSGGSAYSQMPFQYGGSETGNGGVQHGPNRNESPTGDEPETPFVLPAQFEVPPSIQLPETMKQHAIIEKTARFIASQGTQMEILLKAKQSNNAQFEFLIQNSKLNPYYKYVMQAIKNGKYPDIPESPAADAGDAASNPWDAQELSPVKTVITVPTIKYKPSADCAYTQLISKIKGVPLPSVLDTENAVSSPATQSPTPAGGEEATDAFTPVLLKYNNSTYVQEESSSKPGDENTSNSNSCAEPQVELLKNSSALALAQGYSSDSDDEDEENAAAEAEKKVEEPIKPPVTLNFPIPTDNLQNIIDKTATYVIKNGRQFEETLRTKSEERFTFLLPNNEYYPYYMYKITGDPDAASKEEKTRKAAAVAAALLSKKGLLQDKTISPVSFSIKPKDDIAASNLAPALHQEPSDEDEENPAKKTSDPPAPAAAAQRNVPEHVQKAIKMVESQLMARNAQLAAVVLPPMMASINAAAAKKSSSSSSRFDIEHPVRNSSSASASALSRSAKMEMERNALYEQQQQNRQKEIKKAEERVKDKLAQIAREKLGGLLSKEKQLQLERKRKAMVFLNQIKGETNTSASDGGENVIPKAPEGEVGSEAADGNASDASNTSVHSIPITSYGPEERTDDEEEAPLKALPYILTTTATAVDSIPKGAAAVKAQLSARTTTVTLSDDDDDDEVQVINETKATTATTARLASREKIRRAPSSGHTKHYRRRGRSKENTEDSCCSSSTHTSSMSSSSSEDDEPFEKRRRRGKSAKSGRDDERREAKLKKEKRHRSRKSKSKSKSKKKHYGSPARRASSYSSYAVDSKERGTKRRSRSRSPSRSSTHRRERRQRDRSRSRSRDSSPGRSHSRRKHGKKSKSKSKSRHD